MENSGLGKVIGDMIVATSRANPIVEGDYVGEDELKHCAICHEAKQDWLTALGKKIKHPRLCKCRREAIEREQREREEEEQFRLCEIKRQKAFRQVPPCIVSNVGLHKPLSKPCLHLSMYTAFHLCYDE